MQGLDSEGFSEGTLGSHQGQFLLVSHGKSFSVSITQDILNRILFSADTVSLSLY